MSRPKTPINPKRAERVKTMIDRENISQSEFADRVHLTQQAISRIINMKTALIEATARDMIEAFPGYRLEWLLGLDDYMTESDLFDAYIARIDKEHDTNVYIVRQLAALHGVDVTLYTAGMLHANGKVEDDYIVRRDGRQTTITYSDLTDLIADLAALTESRLTRIIDRANQ